MTNFFKLFVIANFCFILSSLNPCYAWEGYDYTSRSSIEIESGNLVREGLIIEFYDSADGNYHTGKVIFLDEDFNGASLTIEDYNQKKTRIFKMRN